MNYTKENEYKEKLIDLLLIVGGKLHFFDNYFTWKEDKEVMEGVFLETPDSMEISCWTLLNKTRPGKAKKEVIGDGWNTGDFYKKLYEHCIIENKKIYEIGCWCV